MVFSENFESSEVGVLPTGWVVVFSGQGKDKQGVRQEQGNKYLCAAGASNWSGVLRYDFAVAMPDKVRFSFRIQRTGGSNGFGIGNGTVCVGGNLKDDLGIGDTNWHSVVGVVDFSAGTASWTVDGAAKRVHSKMSRQDPKAQWATLGERPGIVFDSGNQGNQEIHVDDIVVGPRNVTTTPAAPSP